MLVLQAVAMIWPRTGLFAYILANIFDLDAVYRLVTLLLSWIRIVAVTVTLVHALRY